MIHRFHVVAKRNSFYPILTKTPFPMSIPFQKYHGTGNDFVMIDQREVNYLAHDDHERIAAICHRRFGVGADGLILLENDLDHDFKMIYYNSDGRPSSMCGNGGRCIVRFAQQLGIIERETTFLAVDGPHRARIEANGWVALEMTPVSEMFTDPDHSLLNTGSPHFVTFVEDLSDINVKESGALIRYSDLYKEKGINVNFVERTEDGLLVGTYERGVEDETLSCGTGVTAAAIAYAHKKRLATEEQLAIPVETRGGQLRIEFRRTEHGATDIWLIGPAVRSFEGMLPGAPGSGV